MNIILRRHFLVRVLVTIVLILATLHIAQLCVYFYIGDPDRFDFIELLDLDYEGNLPSLYSAVAMLLAALLLGLIGRFHYLEGSRGRFHWIGLAVIFLFLAVDEGAAVHEELGDFMENYIDASGILYFAWVVPYGLALLVFLVSYLRFLFRLPRPTMLGFILSGTIYVGGALGLELLGAQEADLHGTSTIRYSVLYTAEELLEMFGIIVFISSLLAYIERTIGTITLRVSR